jgi:hypothetical protein
MVYVVPGCCWNATEYSVGSAIGNPSHACLLYIGATLRRSSEETQEGSEIYEKASRIGSEDRSGVKDTRRYKRTGNEGGRSEGSQGRSRAWNEA